MRDPMQKLTTILVVSGNNEELPVALDKAITLSRLFGARIELLVAASHQAVIRRVESMQPELVVKSSTARHPLRRWSLDASDWRLANEISAPLLLARVHRWGSPPAFAAAIDVADEDNADLARGILQTAGFLALGAHANLDVLYCEREPHEERVRMERTVRLAQMVREFHVGCESIRRLEGEAEQTLPKLAAERRFDVLVLGSPARSESLAGMRPGTASRLIDATDGDVLLVKAPERAATRADRLRRQQRADQRQEFA
jgi:nucleotide-binding universal stress UspA family protein